MGRGYQCIYNHGVKTSNLHGVIYLFALARNSVQLVVCSESPHTLFECTTAEMIPLSTGPTVDSFICSFSSGLLITVKQKIEHFESYQRNKMQITERFVDTSCLIKCS